jgi:hypothetical protein
MAKKPGNSRDPLRDCAGTPPDLFIKWHLRWNFTVDACALPWNTKLPRYWAPPHESFAWVHGERPAPAGIDGLDQDWTGERVWCNPPYGKGLIEPWVNKALQRQADLVVMLLPSRTEMPWFHRLWNEAVVEFLPHRVSFVAPPGLGQDFKKSTNFERSFLAVVKGGRPFGSVA